MIWHNPDKTTITKEEFDKKLKEIFSTDSWIIDGNYQRTIEKRIQEASTIILLDFPTEECLNNAINRIGNKRSDMPWTEEILDKDFQKEILLFNSKKLPVIYDLLLKHDDKSKEIFIFKTRDEIEEFIETLLQKKG